MWLLLVQCDWSLKLYSWFNNSIRVDDSTKGLIESLCRKTSQQWWSTSVYRWVQRPWQCKCILPKGSKNKWMEWLTFEGKIVVASVRWVRSHTLFEIMKVEEQISERTHKLNILKFYVKMWCSTHSYDCSWFNIYDPWCSPHEYNILIFKNYPISMSTEWVTCTPLSMLSSIKIWDDSPC